VSFPLILSELEQKFTALVTPSSVLPLHTLFRSLLNVVIKCCGSPFNCPLHRGADTIQNGSTIGVCFQSYLDPQCCLSVYIIIAVDSSTLSPTSSPGNVRFYFPEITEELDKRSLHFLIFNAFPYGLIQVRIITTLSESQDSILF
jgi:hypothetical protein